MNSQYLSAKFSRTALTFIATAALAACGGSGAGSDVTKTVDASKNIDATAHATAATTTTSTLKITKNWCYGGTQGTVYAGCTITASGGTPPYTFGVATSGKFAPLPEGMTINPTTGVVSSEYIGGQGFYGTQFMVTDAANNTAMQVVNFAINGNNKFLSTIFPANSIFHHRVDFATTGLPVDTSPAAPIAAAYLTGTIKHFFGNSFAYPWPYGTPAISVPATQAFVPVTTTLYNHLFTSGPIPSYTPVEGTFYSTGDKHVVVYMEGSATTQPALYEMYQGAFTGTATTDTWSDSGNSVWTDVATTTNLPANGGTNAAGLPNGPLLLTADEVLGTGTSTAPNGTIKHTIRMTLPSMLNNWVWPATATAGTGSCASVSTYTMLSQVRPPVSCTASSPAGEIYRLKAGTTMPACVATSPQTAIIITALQNYGMIVGDNGQAGQLIGTADARWNDDDLNCLNSLTLADFEPVNVSSLMISANSGDTNH